MPLKIGVIGGMGPEATIEFMRRVMAAVPAQDDCDHIPMLVDNNTQIPSRIAHLIEGGGEDPTPVLCAMAKGLEAGGAKALAIPCNTAHAYADAISDAVGIPLLDMVKLSAQKAAEMTEGPIGILASPASRITGIFDRALEAAGRRAVYVEDENTMLRVIRDVKRQGPTSGAERLLQGASRQLLGAGARLQLIACSELSLLANPVVEDAAQIDTVDVLTEAVVNFAMGRAAG